MDLNLKDKHVLVTGAASGIGRACAEAFLAEGAKVTGVDLGEYPAELAAKITAKTGSVTDMDVMRPILAEGDFDVIINNAGISMNNTLTRLTDEDMERTLDINVKSMLQICREYLKVRKKRGGAIVNIASVLGVIGAPLGSLYGASKGAVIALTRSIAVETVKAGFRCNAICPGMVETPMTEGVRKNKNMLESNINSIPMKRFAEPSEIASVAVFLASDKASYITGQPIVVDGGFTVR